MKKEMIKTTKLKNGLIVNEEQLTALLRENFSYYLFIEDKKCVLVQNAYVNLLKEGFFSTANDEYERYFKNIAHGIALKRLEYIKKKEFKNIEKELKKENKILIKKIKQLNINEGMFKRNILVNQDRMSGEE